MGQRRAGQRGCHGVGVGDLIRPSPPPEGGVVESYPPHLRSTGNSNSPAFTASKDGSGGLTGLAEVSWYTIWFGWDGLGGEFGGGVVDEPMEGFGGIGVDGVEKAEPVGVDVDGDTFAAKVEWGSCH